MKKNNKEYTIRGSDIFSDKRGVIENFYLDEKINLVATITSEANTLRSNHYHPVQEQKCILISGQYVSVYQDLKDKNSIKHTHVINSGDLAITKPNVAHTMLFSKKSIFLNLVNGDRKHINFGKTHTIPYELVNEKEKKFLLENYIFKCRVCENDKLIRLISLGFQPYSNDFQKKGKENLKYPLEVNFCSNCHNAQLSVIPDFKKIYKNYIYKSSISSSFINHFDKACEQYLKNFKIKKNDLILDIGSNDGIGLFPYQRRGFNNLIGFEPSSKLSSECKKKGIKIINDFFNERSKHKIKSKAKIISASNVFAHINDPKKMLMNMKSVLSSNGIIIIEVQYLLNTIKDLSFDNIYHEHVNYWCISSLNKLVKSCNLKIFDAELVSTHGGSLRVYICRNKHNKLKSKKLLKIISEEKKFYKNFKKNIHQFENKVKRIRKNVIKNLSLIKKKYNKVIGYGASAKATVMINYLNIDNEIINYVIDDNPLKSNKCIPGKQILIKSIKKSKLTSKDCIIVFAWNFFREIKNQNLQSGITFLSIRDLFKKIIF